MLLVPLLMLPLLTAAGLAGAVLHLPHSSLLLYWPVALLVAGGVACCRPSRTASNRARVLQSKFDQCTTKEIRLPRSVPYLNTEPYGSLVPISACQTVRPTNRLPVLN